MKKITAAAVLLLLLVLMTACAAVAQPGGAPASASSVLPEGASSAPADSYTAYSGVEGEAVNNIIVAAEPAEELYTLVNDTIMPLVQADMALMPIKAAGAGEEALSELEALGVTGVTVSAEEGGISIAGETKDGVSQLMCVYDEAADSMSVTADAAGKQLFFEYARVGEAYAAQYYLKDDALHILLFIEGGTVVLGADTAQQKPDSIPGGGFSADRVKEAGMYCVLEGGSLTVYANGEEKTY
jgi:hypothetical protein